MKALSEKLVVVVGDDPLSVEAQRNATILFMSLLRSTLASKRVLAEFKLKHEAFDWLIGEIETKFNSVSHSPAPINPLSSHDLGDRQIPREDGLQPFWAPHHRI